MARVWEDYRGVVWSGFGFEDKGWGGFGGGNAYGDGDEHGDGHGCGDVNGNGYGDGCEEGYGYYFEEDVVQFRFPNQKKRILDSWTKDD